MNVHLLQDQPRFCPLTASLIRAKATFVFEARLDISSERARIQFYDRRAMQYDIKPVTHMSILLCMLPGSPPAHRCPQAAQSACQHHRYSPQAEHNCTPLPALPCCPSLLRSLRTEPCLSQHPVEPALPLPLLRLLRVALDPALRRRFWVHDSLQGKSALPLRPQRCHSWSYVSPEQNAPACVFQQPWDVPLSTVPTNLDLFGS